MIKREQESRAFTDKVEHQAYNTAIEAAIKASEHVLKYWPNPSNPHFDRNLVMEIFDKSEGVGNYATIADIESERIILNSLQQHPIFRNHHIIAEESDEIAGNSEWQWVIDPIDGTPPFRNGLPEFGVMIGLLHKRVPTVGVIAMPTEKKLVAARRNHGVQLLSFEGKVLTNLNQLKPDQSADLAKSLVAYDLGYEQRGRQLEGKIAKLADKVGYPVCYGSVAASIYRLSLGTISGYLHERATTFDIGAASAIVPELGGIISDFEGKPIDWSAKQHPFLVARNTQIHSQLLKILNS